MNTHFVFKCCRAGHGLAVLLAMLSGTPAFAASGTLVMLRNPTNSAPRIVSLWGGAGSMQIILKSDGTVWD